MLLTFVRLFPYRNGFHSVQWAGISAMRNNISVLCVVAVMDFLVLADHEGVIAIVMRLISPINGASKKSLYLRLV